jgi:hypothetical protein
MNMKNLVRAVALAAAVAAAPSVLLAQKNQFEVGSKVLSVGVLLGGTSYTYGSGGIGLGAGFEVGVTDIAGQVRLGVGGFFGYQRDDDGVIGTSYSVSSTTIAGFVNGHYQLAQVPKLDLYAGPVVGISRQSLDFDNVCTSTAFYDCSDSSSDPAVGVQVGARYEIAPRILGSLQLSGGTRLPWVNAGIAIKF